MKKIHPLDLYRLAVQCPLSEIYYFLNLFNYFYGATPTVLREDFCGTAELSTAWVRFFEDNHSIAVDHHPETLKWAEKRSKTILTTDELQRFHLTAGDVSEVKTEKSDIIASLNFSTFGLKKREVFLNYLKSCHTQLNKEGLFVMDLYGGPGAMKKNRQKQLIEPPAEEKIPPFTYLWDQCSYDVISAETRCAIHFQFENEPLIENAFIYDWRLWTPAELSDLFTEAGFSESHFWCDEVDKKNGLSDGQYYALKKMNSREDWVAYFVSVK